MARKKTSEYKILLPERLDPAEIGGVFQSALAARGKPLLVDAGSLRYVGAQGIQLLLSVVKTWQRDGLSMRLTNVRAEVLDVLPVLGISATLLLIEEVAK